MEPTRGTRLAGCRASRPPARCRALRRRARIQRVAKLDQAAALLGTRAGGGGGLGLSIVKSIVALQRGSVSLVSEVGAGTRVTLRFPIVARERPAGPDLTAATGA